MPDRLAALLDRFSIQAQVFQNGPLCGVNDLQPVGDSGQLHLIRGGPVDVLHEGARALRIESPSLLLYPRPLPHRFVAPQEGAEFTCAHLRFEGGSQHPIARALPAHVCIALDRVDGAEAVLKLLFEEAFEHRCGRKAMLDRLFEVVLIQILRHLMEQQLTQVGMLAGLAHPQLRKSLVAMHEQPAQDWTLETLAETAGMSRSVFANNFRDTVGCTPGAYLQRWRVTLAQQALRRGRALKHIVADVGYGSEAALSRAFTAQCGLSPRRWKAQQT